MKWSLVAEFVVAASVGLLAISGLSAERLSNSGAGRTGVAVVDIGKVSQNSARLNQNLETLKKEYEAKAVELKKESEVGNQLTEKLRLLPAGSPERKKLEGDILKLRADFDLHGKRLTENIRDQQTKVYMAALTEIKDELARFSESNGIKLVLRYDGPPAELTDRDMILQEIQKPIVYQRDSEVTPMIVDAMSRRSGSAPVMSKTPGQGGAGRVR